MLSGWALALAVAHVVLLRVQIAEALETSTRVIALCRDRSTESLESKFTNALRVHLRELELELDVRDAPESVSPFDVVQALRATPSTAEAVMVTWIVPQKPRVIVYIFEPAGPRLRARAASVSDSRLAAGEELALMLRSAILAKREGGDLEMAEVALPKHGSLDTENLPRRHDAAQRHLPIPPRPETPKFGAFTGLVHQRALSRGEPLVGIGFRAFTEISNLRIGLGYVALGETVFGTELAKASVQRHPLQAFMALRVAGSSLRLSAELLATLDPMRRRTLRSEAPLASRDPTWRYAGGLAGLLRCESRVFSNLGLSLALGLDFALNPFEYETVWDQETRRLARILPVRPVGDFGLVWVTR